MPARTQPAPHLAPLANAIARAVRRSLNQTRLQVEARKVAARWRVRLIEKRRTSEPLELSPRDLAVIKKVGLIPPERHGDFRIALAGIREDWPQRHRDTE